MVQAQAGRRVSAQRVEEFLRSEHVVLGETQGWGSRFEAFCEEVGLDLFLTYSYSPQPINSFIPILTSD